MDPIEENLLPEHLRSLQGRRLTHLLYLHGFRSSPQSVKARLMAEHMSSRYPQVQWWCPQLSASPGQAMQDVLEALRDWPRQGMAVVGSSLGGFYAHWLASRLDCPAVLLNPAVHPARDLARYIGTHPAWHDSSQQIHFQACYIDELKTLQDAHGPHHPPELAVIAKGDEVLDWREMWTQHGQSSTLLIEGGDHALSGFEALLPRVMHFLMPD